MFNWNEFEKIKSILSHMAGDAYSSILSQHHLKVRPVDLYDWVSFLKDDLDFFSLQEIAGLEQEDGTIELVYHFLNMNVHQRLNLHLVFSRGESVPSISEVFPSADWCEKEQAERVKFNFIQKKGHLILTDGSEWQPTPLPKLPFNPNKSEPPYKEESYIWKRFDLLSSVGQGDFEWNVCFDPKVVVDSYSEIGFHHQDLENKYEKKDIFQILTLVDGLNFTAAPTYSTAWTMAIEDLYRIKVPERAQAIRIALLELARIVEHLTVLQGVCFELRLDEYRQFLNAREKITELVEKFTGSRHGFGICRIGGVREDLPHGWLVEFQKVSEILTKNLTILHHSLLAQDKFRSMLSGPSVNAHAILHMGVSGPAMRAAGLNFDLRKTQPFYFYQDIDFDVPVGINGTSYDRFLIRYEEIFQSMRIITQVIDNLPLGEICQEEFARHSTELKTELEKREFPQEWHYKGIEGPSGESGFLFKFGTTTPSRLKIKTPSFFLVSSLPLFIKGLEEPQLAPTLQSLGISRWELDR